MQKPFYYIVFALVSFVFTGCSNDDGTTRGETTGAELRLFSGGFSTRLIDDDNPASEQVINDITVLLTAPSSEAVSHLYSHVGFTSVSDYKVVTLPIEPEVLGTRDIYVVTNHPGVNFTTITSITDLLQIKTPTVDKDNNFDPADGFCMYGTTAGYDFVNATAPAVVMVERTCAKFRISLTFPQQPALSTDNTFVITHVPKYTFLGEDIRVTRPNGAYFNFARPLPLTDNGAGAYVNTVYVYESLEAPGLYMYTRINDSAQQQEFIADLPVPQRNYFYDVDVRIYQSDVFSLPETKNGEPSYEMTVTVYDAAGNRIENP